MKWKKVTGGYGLSQNKTKVGLKLRGLAHL